MAKTYDYCAIILTHGRADSQRTLRSLRRAGYRGEVILAIDSEDKQRVEYKALEKEGLRVLVFDLPKAKKRWDMGDNFGASHDYGKRGTITHARNEAWDVAERAGYRYFIELDDDYTGFDTRMNDRYEYGIWKIANIELFFEATFDLLKTTPIDCIAWSQGGDFIGGAESVRAQSTKPWRKVMNVFFCDVERPFHFPARMNDDVTLFTVEGSKGKVFFTTPLLSCNHAPTQSTKGGITDLYLTAGTYVKSMYSVMMAPSAVVCTEMTSKHRRIHHNVLWDKAVPKIVHERWRKSRSE